MSLHCSGSTPSCRLAYDSLPARRARIVRCRAPASVIDECWGRQGGMMEPMRWWPLVCALFLAGCGQAAVSYGPAMAPDQPDTVVNSPLIQKAVADGAV